MATTNYEWFIENNLDKYAGKWVAIDDNRVLDSDTTLDKLLKKLKDSHPKSRPLIGKMTNKLLRLHS
ncbi:hypothetical protein HYS31_04835 [Candidatus Woesearchaeota archaeon]|nr:hypothetical protein [Candidatus Woesearchaeota archaeon]